MGKRIRVGVSRCLLGEPVRYDGGHKLDHYVADVLGRYFDFVGVCPEVECGLPVPRESMRLEGDPEAPRLVTGRSRVDHTERMLAFCRGRVAELEGADLCGFIFKKDSPSSGLFKVRVHNAGMPSRSGRGLFAGAVAARFPLLPVEEEGRLNDDSLRENFLERVFACRRWKDFLAGDTGMKSLVAFHTDHKLQVMAHSPAIYAGMGRLVAGGKKLPRRELLAAYEELFHKALSQQATARKNVNVLHHVLGYFKKDLDAWEKAELLRVVDDYRRHLLPLVVPVTLLRHYVRKYGKEYLERQTYLSPHPDELMLRNHV